MMEADEDKKVVVSPGETAAVDNSVNDNVAAPGGADAKSGDGAVSDPIKNRATSSSRQLGKKMQDTIAGRVGDSSAEDKESDAAYEASYAARYNNLEDILKRTNEDIAAHKGPESAEDRARRERRERNERMIAGIGDISRALSNLYFTTRYAPDSYRKESSGVRAAEGRIARARAEREARDKEFYDLVMQRDRALEAQAGLVKEKEARAQAKVALELKRAREAAEQEYKEKERELNLKYKQGQIDAQEHDKQLKKADQDRKDKLANSQIQRNQSAVRRDESTIRANDARTNGQGGGRTSYHFNYNSRGERVPTTYSNKTEFAAAVRKVAKQKNIDLSRYDTPLSNGGTQYAPTEVLLAEINRIDSENGGRTTRPASTNRPSFLSNVHINGGNSQNATSENAAANEDEWDQFVE